MMIVLAGFQNTFAQAPDISWERTEYVTSGTSRFYDVEKTSDGGLIAIGWKDGDGHALIVKTNSFGQEQWRYDSLISPWTYAGTSIRKTSDGGYIAGGYWQSDPDGGMKGFVLKLSSTGEKQWMTANLYGYNSSKIFSVRQNPDGTYIFGGTTHDNDTTGDRAWLGKISASGTVMWANFLDSSGGEVGSIEPISDALGSGYVLALYNPYNQRRWAIRLNSEGTIIKEISIDNSNGHTHNGSVIVTNGGFTAIYSKTVPGFGQQIFVNKYILVPVGAGFEYGQVFSKMYGGNGDDTISKNRNIKQIADNGFIFVATTNSTEFSPHGLTDLWAVRLDADGVMKWQKAIGSSGADFGYGVDVTSDGGYIFSGRKTDKTWLVKLRAELGTAEITKNTVSIFPNPVRDILNIKSDKEIESVSVFDISGQKIISDAKANKQQLNVSRLTSGTYLLNIKYQTGETETIKILKE